MINDKAQELGRLLGQSDEYKGVLRARERVEEAKDLNERLKKLQSLAEGLERHARDGREPSEEEATAYERLLGEIQTDARYQGLVAAQSNFDKLMFRVNQHIMEGLTKGASSPIITLS
jgi:cell fate (sporulation/competence/biofilm development) regulator YlbF (YheA/YmcA/DUF963 family)